MNDFIKIDVTSDRDFNNIPAGASLADSFYLLTLLVYNKCIDNHYSR